MRGEGEERRGEERREGRERWKKEEDEGKERKRGVKGVNSLPSKLGRKVESGLKARSGSVTARKTRYRLHTL